MIPLKRHSRIILLAYIFSNLSVETSLQNIVVSLQDIYAKPLLYDEKFVDALIYIYNNNKEDIWKIITHYTKATDLLILSIIAIGVLEMAYRYHTNKLEQKYRVIVSECLQISDLYETPSTIINAVLHKIYKYSEYKKIQDLLYN